MTVEVPEPIELYPRKVVFATYAGPNSGLGQAVRPVYAWVGTYYQDRVGDVTVCFAQRPTRESIQDKSRHIEVEVRFEVEDHLPTETRLPKDLNMKPIGAEYLIVKLFKGALPDIMPATLEWMEAMEQEFRLKPGYRQRFLTMGKLPTDLDWELEVQLVLGR